MDYGRRKRKKEGRKKPTKNLLPVLLGHLVALALEARDQLAALRQLLPDVVDGLLEDEALGAALALEPRHDLAEAVEAGPDRLAPLLFWGGLGVSSIVNNIHTY